MFATKDWPHAPVHRFNSDGIYMVTGATLGKKHVFNAEERLNLLESELLSLAKKYLWHLEAWAVFVNHYHFIARTLPGGGALNMFLKHLHSNTSRKVNSLDCSAGREVWHNFWDKKLTYQRFTSRVLTTFTRMPLSTVLSGLLINIRGALQRGSSEPRKQRWSRQSTTLKRIA